MIRWLIWKCPRRKVVIKRFGKLSRKGHFRGELSSNGSTSHINGQLVQYELERPIRIATFNVAMFSLAPAVPEVDELVGFKVDPPKSILKQSPLHASMNKAQHLSESKIFRRTNLKVSINLPDNEISLANSRLLTSMDGDEEGTSESISIRDYGRSHVPARSPVCFPHSMFNFRSNENLISSRSILEVLREIDADVLALQDVKAEEEKSMKPLSDLASALGMKYVFAESWAPEYGNAILSKWPIKRWKVQKIADDDDFRNVLKATVNIPGDSPHILAGGLNSLNGADYSLERWTDIVKYYEKIGKPKPKVEVMNFLKEKNYTDAKENAGECESVVIIAKGQNVQGTCKYGTRVDYILASGNSNYKFVPGSYSVISSKGTSDHHIVKAEVVKVCVQKNSVKRCKKVKQKFVRIRTPCSSASVWGLHTNPTSSRF
ncbi:Endonuclease/exonuclease/phosphatase family protein [Quillaja saponaria]|uniref:Endonuclease/exonuclease/phosphatase family protein n=1 Tax=Quillaja saponaria TaxID=32244 RepID=A0AAD7LBC5_QUISA|nr:Endonuclease/exonuclease/phosphatase family protein [Quillaja saponaria]